MCKKVKVSAECSSCGGTGIYVGFIEAKDKGKGVVCLDCDGTGKREIEYTPFSGRKERPGIQEVFASKGKFILSWGPGIKGVSYEEFKNGKMPEIPKE